MSDNCSCSPLVESSVTINAKIFTVWRVFIDFKAWREWNPLYKFMKTIQGDITKHDENQKIELETAVRFFPQVKRVHVTKHIEHEIIQWKYSSYGLSSTVTNTFTYDEETNQTTYHREERMAGFLSGITSCFIHNQLQKLSGDMCEALKNRCEKFQNLAMTIEFPINDIYMPVNEEDVVQILHKLRNERYAVFRPYGGKHSWAPSVTSSFSAERLVIMIDTAHMQSHEKRLVAVNGKSCIAIGPGFTQGQMAKLAAENGRCLPVTGALQESIRVGGFLASGCHGTGNYPPVSEFVQALRIVCFDKNNDVKVLLFTEDENFPVNLRKNATLISSLDQLFEGRTPPTYAGKSLMDVVRVHFGTLGIVTQIFIETEEQFYVDAKDEVVTLERVIPKPSDEDDSFVVNYLMKKDNNNLFENDYLELFYSPFNINRHIWNSNDNKRIWLKRAKRTTIVPTGCCRANACYKKSDPLGFHKNPLNNWLNDTIQLSSDDLQSSLLKLNSKNQSFCSSFIGLCFSLFGNVAQGLGLNPCCSGIFGSIGMCFGVDSHKYTVPFNSFSLYQRIAPEKIWDQEMEIPIDLSIDPQAKRFRRAWWYVIEEIEKSRLRNEFPLNIMFHCRFNRRSKSILSSCYSPIDSDQLWFATIEFLSVTGGEGDQNNKYKKYFQEFVTKIMDFWLHVNDDLIEQDPTNLSHLKPRPHFAKNWYDVTSVRASTIDLFKENIILFEQIRIIIDPYNKFNGGLVPLLLEEVNKLHS
eukprot:gene14948-20108_t